MNIDERIEIINDANCNRINVLKPVSSKQIFNVEDNKTLRINLNGEYKFKFNRNINDIDSTFWDNIENFNNITVPSNIEFNGYGDLQYVNTQYPWDGKENVDITKSAMDINYCGQYVRQFEIDLTDNKYHLSFEGVESCFFVWINGEFVGYNEDSFTTVTFDITDRLINGTNTVAIEVYKYNIGSWLNDQDFWRLSGIFRDVYIDEITEEHIIDYVSNYELDLEAKTIIGKIELEKSSEFPVDYVISYDDIELACGSVVGNEIKYKLDNVNLWNAQAPNLYSVELSTETECFTFNIGYRKIELVGNQILFNGSKLHIKGVNRHEFNSMTGRVQTYKQILDDLKLLKSMHVNSIRTSHYPNCNMFYELCDQLGFMVMDEVNLETHGTWMIDGKFVNSNNILPGDNSEYQNRVLDRMKNMYYRDRNRTSVIFWSLGNESFGGETIRLMNDYLKQNDNRLVHYEGVFWDRRDSLISDFESQMYTPTEKIEAFIKNDDSKPFIVCEYSHAMGNSNGNLEDYTNLFYKCESFHGGYIWEFTEQLIEKNGRFNYGGDFGNRPTDGEFICDGIVSDYCRETPERYYIANVFSPLSALYSDGKLEIRNLDNYPLRGIRMDHIISEISGNRLISSKFINVEKQLSFNVDMCDGINLFKFYNGENELKTVSIDNRKQYHEVKRATSNIKFIDGDNNFGLYGDDFEIMFSKSKNALISYKYDGQEIFESMDEAFVPNFYRAITNNDRGANKHNELGILEHISYNYQCSIKDYNYSEGVLAVDIEFTNYFVSEYNVIMSYKINSTGRVEIIETVNSFPIEYAFNFGLRAKLSEQFKTYTYLGCGPYDTYSDRKYQVPIAYHHDMIGSKCPYIVPQEYGNKCDVSMLNIVDGNGRGIRISMDNYEFSLNKYTDRQLDAKRNVSDLTVECNFLRINKMQTGVGGDDSWGLWAKDKYIVRPNNERLKIIIEKI